MDSLLTAAYFNTGSVILDSSGFGFETVYYPSGSNWALDSFPESLVFKAELSYANPQDSSQSYQLRIGKGGQLYSFRSSFGESVPPQFRPSAWTQASYGGGTSYAPWVDEVWQMVCVDGELNNPPDSSYFIHQAGVYLKTPNQTEPFYSPIVAEYYSPEDMSYTVVSWGQQAHTDDLQNINYKSGLLYYTTYSNKGQGIIQVDNMIYNFGQDNINFLNMPWGGVRNSSLDHFFISTPMQEYNLAPGLYGNTPIVQTASTGGWVAWANDTIGQSPTLGMVHPVTTNTNNNVFRYGDAGDLSQAWNQRDYHVFEMIRFPAPGQLDFGKSMSFRYFYVLGASIDSVKNTIVSENLISNCLDTAYIPAAADVTSVRYLFQQLGESISTSISTNNNGLLLRTSPYIDSYPLFKIRAASNEDLISSDPYVFSEFAYDGTTIAIDLLGFLDTPSSVSIIHDTICAGESYIFPDGTSLTDVLSDSTQLSILASSQIAWDSLIVTNLVVKEVEISVGQSGASLTSETTGEFYQWLDCDNNLNSIAGATDSIYTVSVSGNYALEMMQNGCIDTSACYIVSLVGISESSFEKELSVYPNPTDGDFSIDLGSIYESVAVSISQINGKMILSKTYRDVQLLNLSLDEAPGVYMLHIASGNHEVTVRLTIE